MQPVLSTSMTSFENRSNTSNSAMPSKYHSLRKDKPMTEEKLRTLRKMKYKTEMCIKGNCEFGSKCDFAHSITELRSRPVPSTFKTVPCKKENKLDGCRFQNRCSFLHSNEKIVPLKTPRHFAICNKDNREVTKLFHHCLPNLLRRDSEVNKTHQAVSRIGVLNDNFATPSRHFHAPNNALPRVSNTLSPNRRALSKKSSTFVAYHQVPVNYPYFYFLGGQIPMQVLTMQAGCAIQAMDRPVICPPM